MGKLIWTLLSLAKQMIEYNGSLCHQGSTFPTPFWNGRARSKAGPKRAAEMSASGVNLTYTRGIYDRRSGG
jgi:hypothetical protein